MKIYKILSVLLTYPEQELIDSIIEIKTYINTEAKSFLNILPLLNYLLDNDLIFLQEQYVELFDRNPSHSLHLFEHLHGEDRARGQAMVDLTNEYREHGYILNINELPDYLPLLLEFLSVCDKNTRNSFLTSSIDLISHIGNNLNKIKSIYVEIFNTLIKLSPVKPKPLTSAPIKNMDEAMEIFGPNLEGVEPLLTSNNLFTTHKMHFFPKK